MKEQNEKKSIEPKISIYDYLASYSRKRNMDDSIIKWYFRKYAQNVSRTKIEWDMIINKFYSE